MHRDVVGERDHVADQHGEIGAERVERAEDVGRPAAALDRAVLEGPDMVAIIEHAYRLKP